MSFWGHLQKFLLCCFGCVSCVLVSQVTLLVIDARVFVQTSTSVAAELPRLVNMSTALCLVAVFDTRREVLTQVSETRKQLLDRVDTLSKSSKDAIDTITVKVDNQLTVLNSTVATNLELANASVDAVAGTVVAAKPVLDSTASTVEQVNNALPMFLDCEANPHCVLNRYIGVAKSTELAMQAVAESAPPTLKSVQATAKSVESIATSWEKQTPFYIRAIGWFGKVFIGVRAVFN